MGGPGSGIAITPEARKKRSEAGKATARKKAEFMAEMTGRKSSAKGPKKLLSIGDYDRLLGRPTTWTDAKKREEVQGEMLLNEQKRTDGLVRRGKLFTNEQVQERERTHAETIFAAMSKLPDLIAAFAEIGKKDESRKTAREFISGLRLEVANGIKNRAP